MSADKFDYIVVGAGSSGATVATRLSERIAGPVLLLEAGAAREKDFWVTVPVGVAKILLDPNYVWQFNTEPQASLVGQTIYWPRGLLPGGSSSVNGMIYVRGEPAEYDHWRSLGNTGWGYDDLLPYFKRLETTVAGTDRFRGRSGPITVSPLAADPDELSDAFLSACQESGIPLTPDYNGESYEGVGYLQLSTRNGRRCSTAVGYLQTRRKNLSLETEAVVTRLLFEGKRAVGVEYKKGDQVRRAYATKEVILSAGPIKSPQLLELSGIGNGSVLQKFGIPVLHHLPGVGENLIDHLQSRITFACSKPIALNHILASFWRQTWMGMKYMATRRGLMATPSATVHALARASADEERPNVKIQLHHLSAADRYTNKNGYGLDPFPGFSIGFFQLRPDSRGYLHIRSRDSMDQPKIDPRYLTTDNDRAAMLDAIRLSRAVSQAPALAPYVDRETRPGPDIKSDDALLEYIKTSGQTSWHPIGTCKMGVDEQAVVDPSLRVRGVDGLRVVDSSIMPTMPSSNTNSGSIMIGEKAADMILNSKAAAKADHVSLMA